MKTKFTKIFMGILAMVYLLLNSNTLFAQAQWVSSGNFTTLYASSNETIKVTNSGGSVGGGNVVKGYANNNTGDISASAGYGAIPNAFTNATTAQLFKATAGKPFTITLEFDLQNAIFGGTESTITMLQSGLGKNEQNYVYDQYITIPQTSVQDVNGRKRYVFTGTYTFPVGRTQAWLLFGFRRSLGNPNDTRDNIIILPFVVEGSTETSVDSLGVTTEPQVPYMVVHNPPGDGSSTTITNTGTKCRSFEEATSKDESGTVTGSVKIGVKGSIGFIATVDYEIYAQLSASATIGSMETRNSSQQTCVTISNSLTAQSSGNGANNDALFVGYGVDLAYGKVRNVKILNGPSGYYVKVDTSLIYREIEGTRKQFFLTKSGIINDIATQTAKVNNTSLSVKDRATALYQINVWKQVIANDSININNAANTFIENYGYDALAGPITHNTSLDYNSSSTINVEHYVEGSVGLDVVVNVGGSGFAIGGKFSTSKRFGQAVSSTGGVSQNISYSLYDNDAGDHFEMRVVKDPVYGTPIFLTRPGTKSSWPYEGGYQRDQPELRFTAAPTSKNYTVPNVAVGQPSIFGINLCNNSNEARSYNMRFNPLSNGNGANIAISGTTGNTEFGSFPVDANSCYPSTFFATITQGNPAALSSQDLNIQLYSFNDQAIASDIYATCNWGNYALPTGISTGQINICQGINTNVSLSATCATGTIATWYNSLTDITSIGTGSPFVQTPTVNNNYYVSCNSGIYNYKRFPANTVKINPIPSVPIISASGPLTFCQPGSVTLKSFLANNNALSFVQASNQYVTVPHSASINLGANFTMEAWVYYSGLGSTIVDKGNYDFLWQLGANGNYNKMGFYYRGTSEWVYSTGFLPQNTWTHVAITLQGGVLTFYINGVASGTAAVATAMQDTQPMNIGRQQPTVCACNHFNGTMDELRLWNYARTPSQILANMNSVPANTYGLAAYYKFDETTGTTITDASGNNNTGTFVNGPTRQIPSTVPSNIINALWTPSNTTVPSITASTFGTYTATVTNGFGCSNSASVVTSSLSPMPTPQANAYYISVGNSASLTATGCSGGSGTYALKWYKSSDNSLVTMPVSPTTTTNYYAKCENTLNSVICLSPASANVTVNVGNYINSIISGNWENSNTWTPSRIPLATDIVIINNHTVTITSNDANAKNIEYKSGATLKYLNAAAKLKVGF
jgi:hypothetical protein